MNNRLEIEELQFRNFLSFGSKWQKVKLKKGFNVVLGWDADKGRSNGAGKSAFMETIPFSLFGRVHRDIKKEQIINFKNRKRCEVHIKFQRSGHTYEVRRGIKPDIFEIYKDEVLIPKPAHVKDYQAQLEEIIGMNYQTFMSLVHSNVNSSSPILDMKKPEKRKFMEKVFNLKLFTDLHDKNSKKIKSVNEKLTALNSEKYNNENNIDGIIQKIKKIKSKMSLKSSELELNEAKEYLKELLDGYKEIDTNDMKQLLKDKKELLNELTIDEEVQKNKLSTFILKDDDTIKKYEDSIEEKKKKVRELNLHIKMIRQDMKNCYIREDEHEELVNAKEKLKNYRIEEGKTDQLQSIKKEQLKKLLSGEGICPLLKTKCDRIQDKSLITSLKEEYKSLTEKNDVIMSGIDECYNFISKYKETHKKEITDKQLLDIAETNSSISKYDDEYIDLKEKRDDYKKEQTEIETRSIKEYIIDVNGKKKDLQKSCNKLNEKLDNANESRTLINNVRNEIKTLKTQVELEKKNLQDLTDMLNVEVGDMKALEESNIQIDAKIKKMNNILDYLDFIKIVCKDENIKQYAVSSVMPYLNKRTNYYLAEVGYGFYTVIDKWLDANIKAPGVSNASYGSLSGGEGRGIDLALQLAFLDIARIQSGVFPDVITFDELLDSSVDSQGLIKLMSILRVKQEEENLKVILISHRTEVEELNIDHVFYVEKKNGYSTVTTK